MARARPRRQDAGSFTERLKEISRFFAGCSQVHKAMRRLVLRLERFEVPYAIVGGMAVNAYGHHQTTDDVDLLLTAESFTRFQALFLRTKYELLSGWKWRYIDRMNGVPLDIVIAGTSAGNWRGSPVVYPDPTAVSETIDNVVYVNLKTLVELKLSSRRFRDLGDVGALIRVHDLDESFMNQLSPAVHDDYLLCLDEKRREDEYEARNS
jgi:hypothetical protein